MDDEQQGERADLISRLFALIAAEVQAFFGDALILEISETFGDASQRILQKPYDLIVVDLLLPRRGEEPPTDVSEEIVDNLMASELNRLTTTVAMSQFDDVTPITARKVTSAAVSMPYEAM